MSDADTVAAKESTPGDPTRRARSVQGSVESARMDKTITVLVERQLQHPLTRYDHTRVSRLDPGRRGCERQSVTVCRHNAKPAT